ncbi:MAG TPA: hypothetical protein VGF84_22015 [Micromonosporaceae bacterium]
MPTISRWRLRVFAAVVLRLGVLVVGGAALIQLAPEPSRDLVLVSLLCLPPIIALLLWTVTHIRLTRQMERAPHRVIRANYPLEPYRLSLTLVQRVDAGPMGRCYRRGRRVRIEIRPFVRDLSDVSFVLLHEVAHAIRNDSTRRRVALSVGAGLLYASVFSFDYRLIVATVVGLLVWSCAGRWIAEIACDRFAVRKAGLGAFEAFAEAVDVVRRQPQNRTFRRRIRRTTGWMTHPPMSWRSAAVGVASRRSR